LFVVITEGEAKVENGDKDGEEDGAINGEEDGEEEGEEFPFKPDNTDSSSTAINTVRDTREYMRDLFKIKLWRRIYLSLFCFIFLANFERCLLNFNTKESNQLYRRNSLHMRTDSDLR
jgi:hypothetical protein